ncbi:TPA: hypothetical protein ACXIGW_004996 [Serratia marcescens]
MDKQEYRLYLAMLKARGDLARKAMADNARRRNLIKAHRQRRSDDIRSLLAWKDRDVSVGCWPAMMSWTPANGRSANERRPPRGLGSSGTKKTVKRFN